MQRYEEFYWKYKLLDFFSSIKNKYYYDNCLLLKKIEVIILLNH